MNKLAIDGGQPARKKPFPKRAPFGAEEIKQVTEAIESQNLFALPGNKVKKFEEDFAKKYGVEYAIASTSGTSAIHVAVAAINPEPGSEVITAPVTDYGTVAGLIYQGCVPVFADWAPRAFNMAPDQIERNITDRTAAIIVVHLFGNPCDMDAVMEIGRKHKLPVIEDCCQAYCTSYKDKLAGTIGDIGCFSMQQSKHLTAGEGGVTITNNADYAMRMGLFKDKGWESRGRWGPRAYAFLGLNYRMNELTGAVALAQLQKVQNVVAQRHALGELITGRIKDLEGITPAPVTPGGWHSYWLYPFTITGLPAERFIKALKAEGIPANWGYTGKPIYLCTEGLRKKRTFGSSGYPFDSPYYGKKIEYEEGLCPVAEEELTRVGTLELNENWTTADAEDAAAAIRKVAEDLR